MNYWWALCEFPFKNSWGMLGPSLSSFVINRKMLNANCKKYPFFPFPPPPPKKKGCVLFWLVWHKFTGSLFWYSMCWLTIPISGTCEDQASSASLWVKIVYASSRRKWVSISPHPKIILYYQVFKLPIWKAGFFVIILNSLPLNMSYI